MILHAWYWTARLTLWLETSLRRPTERNADD
jgi:hypothetical protein